MNKKILIIGGVLVLAVGGYFIGESLSGPTTESVSDDTAVQEVLSMKPDREFDLFGKVVKMEGNIVTIAEIDLSADPTIDMTQDEKKAYMQALPEEERMALKELTTSATLGEVTVLIPVGIPMSKKLESGSTSPDVEATLADVTVGGMLSVWFDASVTDRKIAEYVKVSGSK